MRPSTKTHQAPGCAVGEDIFLDCPCRSFPGAKIDDGSPFGPGTGIATGPGKPYETLWLNTKGSSTEGHHYIIFDETEPAFQRATLLKKIGSQLELSWTISSISNEPIKTASSPIYLIFFKDLNKNLMIDKNEIVRVSLHLK